MSQFAPINRPRPSDWRVLLSEMEKLARSVARGGPPSRGDATVYLEIRAALMASEIAEMLPGFLLQCHSILRLREFLTLYDPEYAMRDAFMARAFERCRAALGASAPAASPARALPSHEWMS